MIDDVILKEFHGKFKDSDINKPEMCNGLDKCTVYKPTPEEKVANIVSNAAKVFGSNGSHESTGRKKTRQELESLTTLNRVSNVMKRPTTEIEKKEQVHVELVSMLQNTEAVKKTNDKDITCTDTQDKETNDIEKNLDDDISDLDKPSQDFLNKIIDEK
jgi:hypothetical protein